MFRSAVLPLDSGNDCTFKCVATNRDDLAYFAIVLNIYLHHARKAATRHWQQEQLHINRHANSPRHAVRNVLHQS